MGTNTLAQLAGEWPQRLLKVDCMTSFTRQDGNIYGTEKEPRYNILTYTWGRFQSSQPDDSIVVHGIEWDIPPILPSHFSVSDFQNVLTEVGVVQGSGWVWVDVACIDQRDGSEMKKIEIGRQAAIFENADCVFVWWTTMHIEQLQCSLDCIKDLDMSAHGRHETAEGRRLWIDEALQSLSMVFSDHWFTSLWTLQEAFARPDATILSREGKPSSTSYNLGSFYGHCSSIYNEILVTLSEEQQRVVWKRLFKELGDIITSIETSGCYALSANSPITLYGAARHRRTSRPCDRIYGIMQIFGLALGESADPSKTFGLEALELQLARALNERSPFLAQTFVHLRAPPQGRSWQINEHTATPEFARGGIVSPKALCSMVFQANGLVEFVGRSSKLVDIARSWQQASFSPMNSVHSIHLDYLPELEGRVPEWYRSLHLGWDHRQLEIVQWLMEIFPAEITVGLLGTYKGIKRGRQIDFFAGLLFVKHECTITREDQYGCIGYCLWENNMDILQGPSGLCWHNVNYSLV
ncbi:hypothetical protein PG993_003123 [Apiospora rasikravindrae]|uniref:Heterokaryon incompatibility domain-containing protein n=1 Tax=Apiospora rasikravindrae TaxID=990691 RepID=A0ABR1U1A6_9PEZI